jgi:hypothetical protein
MHWQKKRKEKKWSDGMTILLLMPGWTGGQHYGRWQPGRPMHAKSLVA